jgi:hypothetical protein
MFLYQGSNKEWLKRFTSEKLNESFVVVLTARKSELQSLHEYIDDQMFYTLNLEYFNKDNSRLFVEKYLEKYNKVE